MVGIEVGCVLVCVCVGGVFESVVFKYMSLVGQVYNYQSLCQVLSEMGLEFNSGLFGSLSIVEMFSCQDFIVDLNCSGNRVWGGRYCFVSLQ